MVGESKVLRVEMNGSLSDRRHVEPIRIEMIYMIKRVCPSVCRRGERNAAPVAEDDVM